VCTSTLLSTVSIFCLHETYILSLIFRYGVKHTLNILVITHYMRLSLNFPAPCCILGLQDLLTLSRYGIIAKIRYIIAHLMVLYKAPYSSTFSGLSVALLVHRWCCITPGTLKQQCGLNTAAKVTCLLSTSFHARVLKLTFINSEVHNNYQIPNK
jgi:hypothetical protein